MRIYTASVLAHYSMWIGLRSNPDWKKFTWSASWPEAYAKDKVETREKAVKFWAQDIKEVLSSNAVLIYAERDDILRGAICEAGAALGQGIDVLIIGDCSSLSTWQYHPLVTKVPNFPEALDVLTEWSLWWQK